MSSTLAIGPDGQEKGRTVSAFLLGTMLLSTAFLYQIGWAWFASIPQLLDDVTIDDTFLYLEFARNTVTHGFPTFDGIHPTNGVQPLWAGVLVVMAWWIDNPGMLVRSVLSLCAVLNLAAGLCLLRGAGRIGTNASVTVVAVGWAAYMLGLSPSMAGMENSLHALVASIVLLVLISLLERSTPASWWRLLLFGFLLALNAAVRLDSVIISLIIGMVAAGHLWRCGSKGLTVVCCLFVPVVVGGIAFAGINKGVFGVAMPVSGMVKAAYAACHMEGMSPLWRCAMVPYKAIIVVAEAPSWLLSNFGFIAILWVGVCLVSWYRARTGVKTELHPATFSKPLLIVTLAVVLHLVILCIVLMKFADEPWYHSWLLMAWLLWLGWTGDRWMRLTALSLRARRLVVVGLAATLVAMQAIDIQNHLTAAESDDLHVSRLIAAEWLDRHVPTSAMVGAWNAGILAYFTNRTVINLDGLMNSPDYARWVRSGGNPRSKIRQLGIDIIVDYNDKDSTMPLMFDWDRSIWFRGIWPWKTVRVLHWIPIEDRNGLYVLGLDNSCDIGA